MAVAVVVLGDIGRSPRMMNHALALAHRHHLQVHLVGYAGSTPIRPVLDCSRIRIHHLPQWPWKPNNRLLYLLNVLLKVVFQMVYLMYTLSFGLGSLDAILVQNPPAIPLLLIAKVACILRGCSFAIDWHNFGYTILAIELGRSHPLVRLSFWYERILGRTGNFHFCVTKALQKELALNWHVKADLLYDRAPGRFRRLSMNERHQFFLRMRREGLFASVRNADRFDEQSTFFTMMDANGSAIRAPNAPALLVSSTSYTADEDFGILVDAIQLYDQKDSNRDLVVVITGKGPQKEMYRQKIVAMRLRRCSIIQAWLEPDDYPLLLGSADLGVSLHVSSSGLDLPMKVVDMFGCGLPACAINFSCLDELVVHNRNGLVFCDYRQLCAQIEQLVRDQNELDRLSEGALEFAQKTWSEAWDEVAWTHFQKASRRPDPILLVVGAVILVFVVYWIGH